MTKVRLCICTSDIARRQHLRSAGCHQLFIPRHRRSMFGRRAFSVAGPAAWNSLPDYLRDPSRSFVLLLTLWNVWLDVLLLSISDYLTLKQSLRIDPHLHIYRVEAVGIDVKTFFLLFYFGHVFTFFNVLYFPNVFLSLKNVGKVQSGKQINNKHFQNNSNEIAQYCRFHC